MGTYGWMLLISIIMWAILIFLFKHCYTNWYWSEEKGHERKKVYLEEDRMTAPMWMYILIVLSLFVPIINVILAIVAFSPFIAGLYNENIYFHIKLPESLKFLTKKY